MVDRISSYSNTSKLINNNMRLQGKYAEGQMQVSSGMKSDSYEGIAKDSSKILSLESDYARLVTQTENAQLAMERADVSYDVLGTIIDSTQPFLAAVNAGLSSTITSQDLLQFAEIGLSQIESLLNTQVAGRFLFAGSATQTPPVDFADPAFGPATTPSVIDTDYYQGNDFVQSVEASDGLVVDYGFTANDPALEEIIRAYDLIRNAPTDPATLQEAFTLLETGLDQLSEKRSSISLNAQALDRSVNNNMDDLNLIDNTLAGLKEVDLAEVTIRLQELQSQLEASYSLTASILRLNLSDYL
jgi:flagellar hook-associated protein 3 FlgL